MRFDEELKTLKDQIKFNKAFKVEQHKNIVVAGMGGSGISGKIFSELYTKEPVFVVDDYKIPDFVDDKTEFFAVSYSGNTEETLIAAEEAKKRGSHVHAITSGGALSKSGYDTIIIPGGLQPRSAIGYLLMPLINTFIPQSKGDRDEAYHVLDEMDMNNGEMKNLAMKIYEKNLIPVIYGSSPFRNIAYRWKTQFNENSKIIAYSNYFSELNHNDTMPLKDTYRKDEFIFMVFSSSDSRISRRIEITGKITGTEFRMIDPIGNSNFVRMLYLVHYGDYVTYHLANMRNVEPQDVSLIEELKRKLSD